MLPKPNNPQESKPKRNYTRDSVRIEKAKQLMQILIREFKKNNNVTVDPETLTIDYGANNQVKLEGKNPRKIDLHPNILSIVCAGIIADGSINKNKGYANPRVQYRHSTRQIEWYLWKTLYPFSRFLTPNSPQFQLPDGKQAEAPRLPNEVLGKVKVATCVNSEITKVFALIAPDGKKTIERSWLNHMTSWFLLVLWLDDGSLHCEGGRQGSIALNSVTLKEAEVLANYIKVVWGVECKAVSYKSKETTKKPESPQIDFQSIEALEDFLRIVAPLVPVKSMLYKVCLSPLDDARRQRWITELKTLVRSDWHDEIDKIYCFDTIIQRQSPDLKDPYKNKILVDPNLNALEESWIDEDS
jgi:hypothetical protein